MATVAKTVFIPDWFTDLNEIDVSLDVKENKITVDFDALAWLMQLRAQNPNNIRYANMIFGNTVRSGEWSSGIVIEPEYVDQANAIRRHFKNKLMVVSLKGQPVSNFRIRVTEIVENPRSFLDSDIPIILRMPDFYEEDLVMEQLIKTHKSLSADLTNSVVDERFRYVGRALRVSRRNPHYRYYFANADQNLLCAKIPEGSPFLPMIRYFSDKSDGMGVRGNLPVYREMGYDSFAFYHLGENYELY